MPKLRATPEEIALRKFNGFVLEGLKRKKLRQADLAKILGIPRESVTNWLNGHTDWKLREVIAICIFFEEDYTILTGAKG